MKTVQIVDKQLDATTRSVEPAVILRNPANTTHIERLATDRQLRVNHERLHFF